MQRAYLVLLAAGCGFHSLDGPPQQVPDGGVSDRHLFTLAELAAGQLVDMTLDAPRAALTPNAYTYGGLVGHGKQGVKVWSHGTTSWDLLSTVIPSGAGLWMGEPLPNGTRVDHLGVVGDPTMTLWLEGEVWLDSTSAEVFGLVADDVAFVELARPGTTTYVRVIENDPGVPSVAVATPDTGWYPIRVGFANGDGFFNFQFTHSDTGGALVPWTRDRLRARTSELRGVLRTVFGSQMLAGGLSLPGGQVAPPVPHFEQNDFLHTTLGTAPQGAPNNDADWSARYLGQLYVTRPGAYMLQIDSDDGNRGRLGNVRNEAHWKRDEGVGPTPSKTVVSATLGAGWNDLVVDYNQIAGTSSLHVRIQGPDFPTLVEIPRDQLRPVEPADDRLVLGVDGHSYNVPEDGGADKPATATMTVAGYTAAAGGAETLSSIDVTYEINAQHWDQITVDLETPDGTRVPIRSKDDSLGNGGKTAQLTIPSTAQAPLSGLLAGPVNGAWKLRVYDEPGGPGNASSLLDARLTLHTGGGPEKIARTSSWTSPVINAGTAVFGVDRVTWNERLPSGVRVRVRTCEHADCSGASWPDPIPQGTAFSVTRGRYLQLKVEMTSDGTLEPELSGLDIAFRRDPG
ncbi:MAG TPA: proprotein convertase P-domain-containing protein [Kofleriaceae bacterium]